MYQKLLISNFLTIRNDQCGTKLMLRHTTLTQWHNTQVI